MDNISFTKPMIHTHLKTWQSNLAIKMGSFLISFTGDDGNSGKDKDTSIRHYLFIGHFDSDTNEYLPITEDLGFEDYANDLRDFLSAIELIEELAKIS